MQTILWCYCWYKKKKLKIEKVKNGTAVSREMLLLGDIEGGNRFRAAGSLLDYGGPEKLHNFK